MAGALWGATGSAEAGVSADSGANATFHAGPSGAVTTGSLIGSGPATAKLRIVQPERAERFSCTPSSWSTSFSTRLASGWTTLTARSQPCTSSTANSTWASGTTFKVTAFTDNGEFICRGLSYGYGTAYWYKTSKGWVWAGATADAIWQKTRRC